MKKALGILSITLLLTACGAQKPTTPAEQPPPEEYVSGNLLENSTVEHDTSYSLDTSASTMGWEASRLAANPHIGTIGLTSGSLLLKEGTFVGGEFEVDMTNITEEKNNERFLAHIKNDDFFGVEQYPTSRLVLTNVTKKTENEYKLTGALTIRDQTHPITFTAQMQENETSLTTTAEFQIDRTKWNIIYDSGSFFQQLGDRAIKDEITYRLNLVFNK